MGDHDRLESVITIGWNTQGLVQDDPVEPRISEIGPVELCGRGLSVSSRMANTVAPNDANVLQRPSGA
jgi:hypothetical protein